MVRPIILAFIWQFVNSQLVRDIDICLKPMFLCDLKSKDKANCPLNHCTDIFKYRCDYETCAISRSVCNDFDRMKSKVRLQLMPFAYQAKLYRFHLFIRSLRPCPTAENWKPNDLCSLNDNCFIPQKSKETSVEKPDCNCDYNSQGFAEQCKNTKYCSRNSFGCQMISNPLNSHSFSDIKSC